ncbi:hypothetical protein AX16_008435 [Volvariella volvacea WC 439]|nr:hypothetical protein AX16_008435 [Volvariella volvacea WC 439]
MGIQERREIMNIRERQMERKRLGIGRRGGRAPWDLTGDRGKPEWQKVEGARVEG